MKVLHVAAEGLPFIKTGGLGDVIGSLPKELAKKELSISVVLPLYLDIAKKYYDKFIFEKEYHIYLKQEWVPVRLYRYECNQIIYYFVEHQGYFEREAIYGYVDDGERFAYFQQAVVTMMEVINYFPDIIHCHDWHTGMIPVMLKENHKDDVRYTAIKTIFTIHNLAYQGNFDVSMLESCLGLSYALFENGQVRYHDGISFMKSALIYADKITTVSPHYAKEILTPQYGEHLENVLQMRQQDLVGIVNGIDMELWNPSKDPYILYPYHKVNVKKMKKQNKLLLQEKLGLMKEDVMLVGCISRFTWQKGLSLLLEQLSNISELPIQLVILGNGETELEEQFRQAEYNHKGKIVFYHGYHEILAHEIYAASDLLLMPSLFEPCGISQLIAMRYGTLPLVRETGGLKDTVIPYNEYDQTGNGFSFTNFSSEELLHVLKNAIDVYQYHPKAWRNLMRNAMNTDVSWEKSANTYLSLYQAVLK